MTSSRPSVQVLVGLLEIFGLDDADTVRAQVVESVSEKFDACVVGIVCNNNIVASVGFGSDPSALIPIANGVPGIGVAQTKHLGPLQTLVFPLEGTPGSRFVVGRRATPFSLEESMTIRAMAKMMRLAVRSVQLLADQQSSTAQLQKQIEANRALDSLIRNRHLKLMRTVLMIQRAVTHSSSLEETLNLIMEQAGELFGSDLVALRLLETSGQRWLWTVNVSRANIDKLVPIDPSLGPSRQALTERRLIVDSSFSSRPIPGEPPANGVMAIPIHRGSEMIGTMTVLGAATRAEPHDEEDQEALTILAGYASVAITKSATVEELEKSLAVAEWRATHDHLTGLANRSFMIGSIESELEAGNSPVILYLDFDGFKVVNDLYGHAAGDEALVAIAGRLTKAFRSDEVVARLAGDEFAALLPAMSDSDAWAVANRVADDLKKPLDVTGRQLILPASIGISTINAPSAEELLEAADLAMYKAKRTADQRIAFFDDDLRSERSRRVNIEHELRLATAEMEDFQIYFQPIVSAPDFEVHAVEALLRWRSSVLGWVSPDEFIPIAEDTGMISRIDEWVLDSALAELNRVGNESIAVSVNVSAASFLRSYLPDLVAKALSTFAVTPSRLAIEVTERVMLGDANLVTANMSALRKMGVSVVLDDFGTGYSSLSYLSELEIDGLKIDRSFIESAVKDPRGAAVVRSVIQLAKDLGIKTVAEGVETPDQLELLTGLGCPHFQGFLFGRPSSLVGALRTAGVRR